jgi:hypothetical protein
MGIAGASGVMMILGTGGRGGTGGVMMLGTGGKGGISGTGGMASGGTGGTMAATGTLAFDVITVNQGGRYAPRNVGAIWIEDSAGKFVKTLKVWAGSRGRYLTKFNTEASGNRTDAVTSATIGQFGAQHATWNLSTSTGTPAANGAYKVLIEVTDHDGNGQSASADFMLTGMSGTVMAPDAQFFTSMKVTLP